MKPTTKNVRRKTLKPKKTRKIRKTKTNRRNKNQKGGFFSNLLSKKTKSKRELEMKCDLTNVSAFKDPFSLKEKIHKCCPNSMFQFMKKKSQVCQDMDAKYEELLKTAKKQNYNTEDIYDTDKLKKIYQLHCPKDKFGYENTSAQCKELKTKYTQLVTENNADIKQSISTTPQPTLGITYRTPNKIPIKKLFSKTAIGPYYNSATTAQLVKPFYVKEDNLMNKDADEPIYSNINSDFTGESRLNHSVIPNNFGGKKSNKKIF
jgi:hypothetical protein